MIVAATSAINTKVILEFLLNVFISIFLLVDGFDSSPTVFQMWRVLFQPALYFFWKYLHDLQILEKLTVKDVTRLKKLCNDLFMKAADLYQL